MKILAIETSCDETGAAVVESNGNGLIRVLSNITATSLATHAKTGGIIPENAAREQVKYITPVITQALTNSVAGTDSFELARNVLKKDIDAIAVTYGPGLIGSLLIGVETVKSLSLLFDKPIIPVNHLLAHLYANWLAPESNVTGQMSDVYPSIGLIVSGGHTDLLLFRSLNEYKWLGGTRDDAAGEALDKIGRLLNLPYPAGPEIERRAAEFSKQSIVNNKSSISFHSPMIGSRDFDFSFSGLKAEAARFVAKQRLTERLTNEICAHVQDAIFAVLIKKTIRAVKLYNARSILLGGGVSANLALQNEFKQSIINNKLSVQIFSPERKFATDNAAMIGAYAALNPKFTPSQEVISDPELYFH